MSTNDPITGLASTDPSAIRRGARRRRLLRAGLAVAAAGVTLGAVLGVTTGISRASVLGSPAVTASASSAANGWGPFGGFGPGGWGGPGGPGGWGGFGPGGWGGFGSGGWGHPAKDSEYFHVESTNPAGPGAIVITGVVNAGGVEHPGRAIDGATFAGGTFRIDHSAGRPTVHFDPATCVGTITQNGPFSVIDGTGRFAHLAGSGRYEFRAIYTTASGAKGCGKAMTAYIEQINGVATLTPAAVKSLK